MRNIGIPLLMEYEDILLHKRKDFSSVYLRIDMDSNIIASIFRYAFEELLQWQPNDIKMRIAIPLLQQLHLFKPYQRLSFPPELNKNVDLFYIAHVMYPDKISYSKQKLTLQVYEKVLKGKIKKFPKGFFNETEGMINACICLQYAINQRLCFDDIEDLYFQFSEKDKIIRFLKEVKLYSVYTEKFQYPIDFLHESLPLSKQSDLFYQKGCFLSEFEQVKGKIHKEWNKITQAIKKYTFSERYQIFLTKESASDFLKKQKITFLSLDDYEHPLYLLMNCVTETEKRKIKKKMEKDNIM